MRFIKGRIICANLNCHIQIQNNLWAVWFNFLGEKGSG